MSRRKMRKLPAWFNRLVWGTVLILIGISAIINNSFFDLSSRLFRIALGILLVYIGFNVLVNRSEPLGLENDDQDDNDRKNDQKSDISHT